MDTTDPNTLSEIESLWDSDWLDVASSQASGDNDSVGFESDRDDVDARPSSRRSFHSASSSQDGSLQVWEGIIEDPINEIVLASSSSTVVRRSEVTPVPIDAEVTTAVVDPEEEQRVKDALDQSMMSTLSSSRPNSLNTSHSSIVNSRDLRLSFPDPLTSSREELLNTSYEDVSPPAAADVSLGAPDIASAAADPGPLTIPVVAELDTQGGDYDCGAQPDLYIVLYGASSAVKWSLIDKLLDKAARGYGMTLTSKIIGLIDGYVRYFDGDGPCHVRTVSVIDRTELDTSRFIPLDRPSLAVIFLPSAVERLPEHTLYLPVLTQSFNLVEVPRSPDQLLDAEQYWDSLGVSRSRLAALSHASLVIDQEDVGRADPRQVARALRPLFARTDREPSQRLIRHAWTILAVLSVVLGYVIKGSLGPTTVITTSQQELTTPAWGLASVEVSINHSVPSPVTSVASSALIPSTLKDFALAVLPAPLVASTSSMREDISNSPSLGIVVEAPSECECGCGMVTWSGKKTVTDLMVRQTVLTPAILESGPTALALIPSSSPSPITHDHTGKGKAKATDISLYSLAGSLSEILDWSVVNSLVVRDVQEILDALDELVRAIGRQTELAWSQSRGAAKGLRVQIGERHGRAKARAKELKELGGRLIGSVQDRVRGRFGVAKGNAKEMRETMWSMDVWKAPYLREHKMGTHKSAKDRRRNYMMNGVQM